MEIHGPVDWRHNAPTDWRHNANDRRERPYDRRQKHDRRHDVERRGRSGSGTAGRPIERVNCAWALLRRWFGWERRTRWERRSEQMRRYHADRRDPYFDMSCDAVLTAEEISFILKHS